MITPQPGIAFLAPEGFEELLATELAPYKTVRYERLFVCAEKPAEPIFWWENRWDDLLKIEAPSIGQTAKALRSLQRSWWPYLWQHFRRGALIQEALPKVKNNPLPFGFIQNHQEKLGSWALLDEKTILASQHCASPRPNGLWHFAEDREGPPSRAYLKLWESFARMGEAPAANEICLDLGASPGGWSWVLIKQLGAKVIAYDRSPLRDDLMASPKLNFTRGDAFAVSAEHLAAAHWLFCDVICYPEKLYAFIQEKLIPSGIKRAVCTIKFQGKGPQQEIVKQFAALPHAEVLHLCANKHELTWIYRRN